MDKVEDGVPKEKLLIIDLKNDSIEHKEDIELSIQT